MCIYTICSDLFVHHSNQVWFSPFLENYFFPQPEVLGGAVAQSDAHPPGM